jgi:D-aminopeptidase
VRHTASRAHASPLGDTSLTMRFSSILLVALAASPALAQTGRARARDLGVAPGIFAPGPLNAITDVAGVKVGQTTIISGDSIHTGVTAILPHGGNLFFDRVPAAVHVGNAFGKLIGATQVQELGELETPILLTCTLCVWRAADALVAEMLELPGMERVGSINPVVGETNDGGLNAIRLRPVTRADVHTALVNATSGPVAEGSVGAGAGTIAFEWKGGIGTSSRALPATLGGWTVGVLVQTNFGGLLQVLGAPVGRELGRYAFRNAVGKERGDGSVMIVVATDAPISDRNLERLAARAIMGLARTGSSASNGSGDFVIAFSTSPRVRRVAASGSRADSAVALRQTSELTNDDMSPLFQAVVEATEEAIYNSLFMATSVTSRGHTVEAIPLEKVRAILEKYRVRQR